jgi:lipopolysaccharide export system protein LptC
MTPTGKKKWILPLSGLVVLVLAGLIGYTFVNHLMTEPITVEDINIDQTAALKLAVLDQVSKKNGVTEWELKAASATLVKSQNQAVLEDVKVVFHTKDGTLVHLASDRGTLDTQTHNLTFSNNVIVRYQGYTLTSDKLQYDKKPHIIHTDLRTRLEKGQSVIEADSMVTQLNSNRVIFKGNVKGNFSENVDMP